MDLANYFESPFAPYVFALVVAIPFMVMLRNFTHTFIKLKDQELKLLKLKSNSTNKSQAYERMTLFMERIKPAHLITKFDKELAVHEFIFLTEKTIQEEFDYNASQQLYLSKVSWENIVYSKNMVLELLHSSYKELSNPSLEEFKTVFLMKYINDDDFVTKTIEELRKELLIVT